MTSAEPPKIGTDKSRQLRYCLLCAIPLYLAAASMLMNNRPLLALVLTDELGGGDDDRVATRAALAKASSLGFLAELFLGPFFGRLADRHGRRSFALLFVIAPLLTRLCVCFTGTARSRLDFLWLDLFVLRAAGTHQFEAVVQALVSDVVPLAEQPGEFGRLLSFKAFGVMVGGALGGVVAAGEAGLEKVYWLSTALGLVCWSVLFWLLPETRSGKQLVSKRMTEAALPSRRTLKALMGDTEARFLLLVLSLHEAAGLTQVAEVAAVFEQEQLGWGPFEIGRFVSAFGMANFLGGLGSGRSVQTLGPTLQPSIAHIGLVITYIGWGSARGTISMAMLFLPITCAAGKDVVLQSRFVRRAAACDVGAGEAVGIAKAGASVVKMVMPVLLASAYSSATKSDFLPVGLPFYLVACLAVVMEILHRLSVRSP